MTRDRAGTGIPGLDDQLEGGFPVNRCVLVSGDTGTGKTTLGIQFLVEGIRRGEPGVLVSVDQKPQHVVEDSLGFGWDLAAATAGKQLALLNASPYFTATRGKRALEASIVTRDLAGQVQRLKARRLVIDSVTSLMPPGPEAHHFLRTLFSSLEDTLGCTVVITAHTPHPAEQAPAGRLAERLASGVMELSRRPQGRFLVVQKLNGTCIEPLEHPFRIIRDRGIVLGS